MNHITPFFWMLLLVVHSGFGQSNLPVDLVQLSKVTLTESPLVKRNLLTIKSAEGVFQVQRSAFDYQLISGFFNKSR